MSALPSQLLLTLALTWCIFTILGPAVQATDKIKLGQQNNITHRAPKKTGRLFSIFNVVTFKNEFCVTASDSTMRGTCLTSSECESDGGTKDGNCASGFGVCCLFTQNTCGGSVNKNCTYLQNAEYPSSAAVSTTCSYTFNRICPNLCQIRLDFDNMDTAQPPTQGMDIAGDCATSGDSLKVTSPTGSSPPLVCGTLTGQHMFLETGTTGTAGTAAFTFGATVSTKSYKIKVTYYQCNSRSKAPADCVQYFTGVSGTVTSYNYPNQMLDAQEYTTCVRQEEGYCTIDYTQSPSTGTDTFDLYDAAAENPVNDAATQDCQFTYITIPSTAATATMYCGGVLATIDADTQPSVVSSPLTPFQFSTFTFPELGNADGNDDILGYSLDFTQQPC